MSTRALWKAYAQAIEQTTFARTSSKYNSRKTDYKGTVYDSAGEAKLARDLDCLLQTGEVEQVERQVSFDLLGLRGAVVCKHRVDFLVHYADGKRVVYEFKGYPTDLWKLKYKLFKDNYPAIEYIVVGRKKRHTV